MRFKKLPLSSRIGPFLALGYRAASYRVQKLLFAGSEFEVQQYDIIQSLGSRISYFEALETAGERSYQFKHLFSDSSLSTTLRWSGSDILVFKQIFVDEEYRPLISMVEQYCKTDSVESIIDAGANVGLTSLYLSHFFRSARIAAIEPDEGNFSILQKNISDNSLERVIVVKAGIWPWHTKLEIDRTFRDGEDWSTTLKTTNDSNNLGKQVDGLTIEDICEAAGFKRVDILKMDIEGGERYFFEDPEIAATFLGKIRFLALEIHDEFNIRGSIHRTLTNNNFFYFEHGETTFAFNKNLVK